MQIVQIRHLMFTQNNNLKNIFFKWNIKIKWSKSLKISVLLVPADVEFLDPFLCGELLIWWSFDAFDPDFRIRIFDKKIIHKRRFLEGSKFGVQTSVQNVTPINVFLCGDLHIIWKPMNLKICEHSIFQLMGKFPSFQFKIRFFIDIGWRWDFLNFRTPSLI